MCDVQEYKESRWHTRFFFYHRTMKRKSILHCHACNGMVIINGIPGANCLWKICQFYLSVFIRFASPFVLLYRLWPPVIESDDDRVRKRTWKREDERRGWMASFRYAAYAAKRKKARERQLQSTFSCDKIPCSLRETTSDQNDDPNDDVRCGTTFVSGWCSKEKLVCLLSMEMHFCPLDVPAFLCSLALQSSIPWLILFSCCHWWSSRMQSQE